MSVRMMTLVWELDLPDSEKLVLLALADCANDEGHCWPGMNTLKRKCSKSDRTVQLAIKMLCAKGHLTRREVLGKGCNYTVHPILRMASDPRSRFAPEESSPPKGTTQTPEVASGKPSRTINSVAKATGVPPADPVAALFDIGVSILTAAGHDERQARSLIGKWRKEKTDGEVLTAFMDCRTKAISNPVEWLQKSLTGVRYVSATGHVYRGDERAVMREAEKRADWNTYYTAKANLEQRAA
jgi:hypothetical protein